MEDNKKKYRKRRKKTESIHKKNYQPYQILYTRGNYIVQMNHSIFINTTTLSVEVYLMTCFIDSLVTCIS